MGSMSLMHWLVVLAIVLVLFGAGKLPRVMGDFAKGIKAFRAGMRDEEPKAVAEQVRQSSLDKGLIYPPQTEIYQASLHVAVNLASYIFEQGLAGIDRPDNVATLVRSRVYRPAYPD